MPFLLARSIDLKDFLQRSRSEFAIFLFLIIKSAIYETMKVTSLRSRSSFYCESPQNNFSKILGRFNRIQVNAKLHCRVDEA